MHCVPGAGSNKHFAELADVERSYPAWLQLIDYLRQYHGQSRSSPNTCAGIMRKETRRRTSTGGFFFGKTRRYESRMKLAPAAVSARRRARGNLAHSPCKLGRVFAKSIVVPRRDTRAEFRARRRFALTRVSRRRPAYYESRNALRKAGNLGVPILVVVGGVFTMEQAALIAGLDLEAAPMKIQAGRITPRRPSLFTHSKQCLWSCRGREKNCAITRQEAPFHAPGD